MSVSPETFDQSSDPLLTSQVTFSSHSSQETHNQRKGLLPRSNLFIIRAFQIMKLFLDTTDVQKIRTVWSWGIFDGVTTNPSHLANTGQRADEVYREIFEIVDSPARLQTARIPQ